ncbi:MAG: hypothetical protein OXH19_04205 [Chloroflexi bacterium]|nr:hypothetical protein [Chloroflexota bacterium]MCY3588229.1 hypothetical protein [Chloroflexota bacterium]MDE2708629.1 hypothetical protein [Chloroflexota bacterium]
MTKLHAVVANDCIPQVIALSPAQRHIVPYGCELPRQVGNDL